MAKAVKSKNTKKSLVGTSVPTLAPTGPFAFDTFRKQLYLLLVIGFVFYANSLYNEYALDDGVMIKENSYVLEGTKGLKKIFTKHSMAAFYEKNHANDEFEGGRYRPLSIASFAIEQSLFGMNPGDAVVMEDDNGNFVKGKITGLEAFTVVVDYTAADGKTQTARVLGRQINTFHTETIARHFTNVLIFLLTIAFVLYLMREQVFRETPWLGFFCALIFTIHPLHTEVIDNIKSRDELMALLFAVMTLVFAFRYAENKKLLHLIFALGCLFLALLSKEYGVVMFALLPLFFYVVLKMNIGKSVVASLPYFVVMVVYFIIRFKIIPLTTASNFHATEYLNNQYIAPGSAIDKFATKIYVLSKYLWLEVYPVTLCVDYSYNQIPFIKPNDLHFLGSLLLHIGIVAGTIWLFVRRHILSFFLLFYLAHLFLISNLMVEIGTTLGERLIYSPSFAFCIILGYGLYQLLQKITDEKQRKIVFISICSLLVIGCGAKVITRNSDWKDDASLFTHDLTISPNSVLVNGNAGKAYIDLSNRRENKFREKELVNLAIPPLRHAIELHPSYVNGYLNIGVAYFKLGLLDSTYENWLKGHALSPNNSLMRSYGSLFLGKGLEAARKNDLNTAVVMISKAVTLDQNNAELWANLGGAYFTMKDYPHAKIVWETALRLDPNHAEAARGYKVVLEILKKQSPSTPK
jgi:tetratricopeptide (TPR) repeat protein